MSRDSGPIEAHQASPNIYFDSILKHLADLINKLALRHSDHNAENGKYIRGCTAE
jgi:hypothetical protein